MAKISQFNLPYSIHVTTYPNGWVGSLEGDILQGCNLAFSKRPDPPGISSFAGSEQFSATA
ncbi:MAG: hypothetical protein ACI9KA_000090 [Parasphingorhabdus sp.]|jgi:hypothetical protein|uniref:hypothetical protein n=1 Tax=Parasphingorhabdus sp. TaxID=2709688 RepID=UPI0039E2FB06|tara:strand:- start:38 stop:220 length:183 start_codon:yes stop_codon:yes gene_type:complete